MIGHKKIFILGNRLQLADVYDAELDMVVTLHEKFNQREKMAFKCVSTVLR